VSADVVTLHKHNFRDVSATLREMADGVERGEYGHVAVLVLAMHTLGPAGVQLRTFGMGPDSEAHHAAALFSKAAEVTRDAALTVIRGANDQG